MNLRCTFSALLTWGALSLAGLAGCSPLPGSSLDPVYLKSGFGRSEGSTQSGTPTAAAPETREPARVEARTTGATAWAGRYQDSRGGGDITMSLVRGQSTTSGTWKLRTGGGGPITMIETSGTRLTLRMENTGPDCPGLFDGWVEITDTALVGAYQGKDCEGAVTEGRLTLHPK